MKNEIWKPVPRDPRYFVSTIGRVKGPSGRILKHKIKDGYPYIDISQNPIIKSHRIHLLMLEAFIGPKPPGRICRHLNGKRSDNRLENICWGTPKENYADMIRHGTRLYGEKNHMAKLTRDDVLEIRRLSKSGLSTRNIAKSFAVTQGHIWRIVRGLTWAHVLMQAEDGGAG